MSPVLHPPWPLQLFNPLQSCLLEAESEALEPALEVEQPVMVAVPATNPVNAAEMINALAVLVIVIMSLSFQCLLFLFDEQRRSSLPRSLALVTLQRRTLQSISKQARVTGRRT